MYRMIGERVYEVKETNGKYFYWSPRAYRWLPVAKSDVVFKKYDGISGDTPLSNGTRALRSLNGSFDTNYEGEGY